MSEPFDLTTDEAAAILKCHPHTLKRWVREGKVAAAKTPGGWYKFRRTDLDTAFERVNETVPTGSSDPDAA